MSTEVLVDILNVLKKHVHISVKFEMTTMTDSTLTTIKLREIQHPSRKTTGRPVVKKERKKKNPCRIRRDVKRREAYLAKKAETGTASSGLALSSPPVLEPSSPRRTATPRRRLETLNTGNGAEREDSLGAKGGTSPIPQLDGLNGDLGEWEEDDGSGVTKTDIANLLKGMMKNINRLGDSDDLKNIEDEGRSTQPNEGDENFEDVKIWALAQKKPV